MRMEINSLHPPKWRIFSSKTKYQTMGTDTYVEFHYVLILSNELFRMQVMFISPYFFFSNETFTKPVTCEGRTN